MFWLESLNLGRHFYVWFISKIANLPHCCSNAHHYEYNKIDVQHHDIDGCITAEGLWEYYGFSVCGKQVRSQGNPTNEKSTSKYHQNKANYAANRYASWEVTATQANVGTTAETGSHDHQYEKCACGLWKYVHWWMYALCGSSNLSKSM